MKIIIKKRVVILIGLLMMFLFSTYVVAEEKETTVDQSVKDNNKTYYSDYVWAGHADGFAKNGKIEKDDYNYGWELGKFSVSGYSSKMKDENGNYVFLKNVGDKITLSYLLEQNINKLNGNNELYIRTTEARDEYFQTPYIDFGRGTLIIRHTDYQGIKKDPVIFSNYLVDIEQGSEDIIKPDKQVSFLEEGDYEVSLDYRVARSKKILFVNVKDPFQDYKIFFKFSVRNGNCMSFIRDVSTGNELTNESVTQNGFVIDMANSKYLEVLVKKEVMADGKNGLVEDVRFNRPASDGEKFTEEGYYTLTTKNIYTGESTVKKIYVGNDIVMIAFANSNYSISEINEMIAQGCSIREDGTIVRLTSDEKVETVVETEEVSKKNEEPHTKDEKKSKEWIAICAISVTAIITVIGVIITRKKKKQTEKKEEL